jgi:putative MFS transporter
MQAIEEEVARGSRQPLPPLPAASREVQTAKASWRDLFSGIYLPRTLAVWVMWFCTYLIVYGISGWLPTIYRTIFKLPLQQALQYSLAATTAGLVGALACAYLIDRTGRRAWFTLAFFAGAVPLFVLWLRGGSSTAVDVMVYASLSYALINTLALGLYLYTPEIYPTRARAIGSGAATAWLRIASMIGPFMIGAILPQGGLGTVFLVFGLAAVTGGVIAVLFTLETRGRVLEELSP